MPRGRLSEKHVQRTAVNWLAIYYQLQSDVEAVVTEMEVVVHPQTRFAYGRADGLIVAQRNDGSIFTAALEAKSARTVPNITLWYRDKRWLLHALAAGAFGSLLGLWIGWFAGIGWWMWVLAIAVFFLVGFCYLWRTQEHRHYRKIDVIEQVKRYPAHERWIAISTDAYNLLTQPLKEALHMECRREGIGLLQVQSTAKVNPRELPHRQRLPTGNRDLLNCYARSERIRQKLCAQLESNRSTPL